MTTEPGLIVLRVARLHSPARSELDKRVGLGTGQRVVSEATGSDRFFDATLAALAVESVSLLLTTVALFFQLRDRRSAGSTEELLSSASRIAEERIAGTVTAEEKAALSAALSSDDERGVFATRGVRISFTRVEAVLEFEVDPEVVERSVE